MRVVLPTSLILNAYFGHSWSYFDIQNLWLVIYFSNTYKYTRMHGMGSWKFFYYKIYKYLIFTIICCKSCNAFIYIQAKNNIMWFNKISDTTVSQKKNACVSMVNPVIPILLYRAYPNICIAIFITRTKVRLIK